MSGKVVARAALDEAQRRAMFGVFARYYEQISRAQFDHDLDGKDLVILLFDGDGAIQGFSTIKHLEVRGADGRLHRGLFSGDTVVAEAFWGQRVLGHLFLRHLFAQKLRHPFAPYWWMLISKGYKTYLLMANNFAEHYPRYERETPANKQEVLDAFAASLFAGAYRKETGLIDFQRSLGQLKAGVAPITADMLEHPRIHFFNERNPTWSRGTELACIARMTWSMPVYYGAKAVWKQWARLGQQLLGQPSEEAAAASAKAGDQ
jgi:hypothetical protein